MQQTADASTHFSSRGGIAVRLACCALLAAGLTTRCDAQEAATPDFETRIAPLFIGRCLLCHDGATPAGQLNLTTREGLLRGGESGPAAAPHDAPSSHLWQRVVAGEMPPPQRGQSQALPAQEIEALRQWLEQGAPWPAERQLDRFERTTELRAGRDWWSLQPLQRDAPPDLPTDSAHLANHPIDAFWLAGLRSHGLHPAPQASRATRLRRITLDLLGLAPTPEQMNGFLNSSRPDAWQRLVDELLASPQYGVRWSRYWLDLVRFAETCGYERDQEKPFAWRYRDWVVDAMNQDMPYDRFVCEQLAGDELPGRSESSVIATGFLRLASWNDEPNDPDDYIYERLEDLVHVSSSAFLGLSVKCARCHDHKFDPIVQDDYYRLAACFWTGPVRPGDRELLGGPSPQELGYDNVLGWTDVALDVDPLQVLKNGERHQPLRSAAPGPLSVVAHPDGGPFGVTAAERPLGHRLQLAGWIVDPRNPLTARVVVNRLWQHHFGQGLVRSPNNFGFRGEKPTHPELLDWLAAELIDHDWSLKHIQRLILTSAAYQMASESPWAEAYQQQDPSNRLWWRFARQRLDAEALRDALLNVGGQLDLRMGGPSFRPSIAAEALEGLSRKQAAWSPSSPREQARRSLYMFTKRGLLPPFMTAFDFCDTTLPCEQRDSTTVATQALAMLNNALAHQSSQDFARRVFDLAGPSTVQRINTAWRLALGRSPSPQERDIAQRHVRGQRQRFALLEQPDRETLAWASLCQVLLNCNEFLYVD